MASIQDIIDQRNKRAMNESMARLADSSVGVTISPDINFPDEMEVRVLNPVEEVTVSNPVEAVTIKNPVESVSINNLDGLLVALRDLSDQMVGVRKSVEAITVDPQVNVHSPDQITVSNLDSVVSAIESLMAEVRTLPKEFVVPKQEKIIFPKLEIPQTFTVDNLDVLAKGLKAINDNVVKLASVVADSKVELPEQDDAKLLSAIEGVRSAIVGMVFPIPTAPTPSFKNSSGQAVSLVIGSDGTLPVSSSASVTTKITESGSDTYIGKAAVGSAQSSAVWQAQKIAVSGANTTFLWADGNDSFDNVATDLTALSYS